MRTLAKLLVLGAALCGLRSQALAAEPSGERFPDPEVPLGILPTPDDALIDPKMARSWGALPARYFVASTVDLGFVYFRPRLSLGYGRPFTQWVGLDLNPVAKTSGLGAYGGLRVEIPHLDLRVGSRVFRSFERTYLPPEESYQRIELERDVAEPALFWTHEAELDLTYDIGPGRALLRGSASYITGVPDGQYVYEETLYIIAAPPLVWRTRGAYTFAFGLRDQHSIGWAVDVLNVPKRDDAWSVRMGPILRMQLSRRVDVRGSFIFTVRSPDRIGLRGGDFTELGLRYRWASE